MRSSGDWWLVARAATLIMVLALDRPAPLHRVASTRLGAQPAFARAALASRSGRSRSSAR